MSTTDVFDGILLVDKPKGPTSHDVVDAIRRRFHIKRVGHCGTLDPMATGLLVLILGRATKLAEKFAGDDKTYLGTLVLGTETDTQDADGQVIATHEMPLLSQEQVEKVFATFRGDLMQTPPMYSAKKIGGQTLYKLARKGKEIERQPRLIHIYDLRIIALDLSPQTAGEPWIRFEVSSSKGTYVRTLAADIGHALGCGAHLSEIRRLRSGRFSINDAHPLAGILSRSPEDLRQWLISPLKLATIQ